MMDVHSNRNAWLANAQESLRAFICWRGRIHSWIVKLALLLDQRQMEGICHEWQWNVEEYPTKEKNLGENNKKETYR